MASKAKQMRKNLIKAELPYGQRYLSNGRVELFNRQYETIASKQGAHDQTPRTEYFYTDAYPPWVNKNTKERCLKILRVFYA